MRGVKLCLVLLAIWMLYVEPQSAQNIKDEQQPTQQNSSPNPLVNEQQKESDQGAEKKEKQSGYITGFFKLIREYNAEIVTISTAVMALFTVALFISMHCLWKSGEIHSERELRAYVLITRGSIHHFEINRRMIAKIKIQNTGQTPHMTLTLISDSTFTLGRAQIFSSRKALAFFLANMFWGRA